jgi:hypothetical protein
LFSEPGRDTDESDVESIYSSAVGDYQNSIGKQEFLSFMTEIV